MGASPTLTNTDTLGPESLEDDLVGMGAHIRCLIGAAYGPGQDRHAAKAAAEKRRGMGQISRLPRDEIGPGFVEMEEMAARKTAVARRIRAVRRPATGGIRHDPPQDMRRVPAQPCHDLRIEGFHADGPGIIAQDFEAPPGKRGITVEPALDLDDEGNPPGDKGEEIVEARDSPRSLRILQAQGVEQIGAQRAECAGPSGEAGKIVIMEDESLAIRRILYVAFDCIAPVNRGPGGIEAVFDHTGTAIMQAAMGDGAGCEPWRSGRRRQR